MAIALATLAGAVVPGASAAARTPRRCSAGLVALTFDDGPSRTETPRLVKLLSERHVPATFFMVGTRIQSAPATARLVVRRGFPVANHTWSHPQLPALSDHDVRDQLIRTGLAFRDAGIRPSRLMRPPYGAVDDRVRAVVAGVRLTPVLWTVDSRDWAGGSSTEIASRILAQLRPHHRNVVLQHDGINNSPSSVDAVPIVVRQARQRGYCFAGLDNEGRLRTRSAAVSALGARTIADPARPLWSALAPVSRGDGDRTALAAPQAVAVTAPTSGPTQLDPLGSAGRSAPVNLPIQVSAFDPWYVLRG